MIFCRGDKGSITSLINLFYRYANSSGQMVNPLKSYIFAGFVFEARLHHIANQLGFKIGRLPFSYLGVPIFKVKPKARHLRPLLDKVISKLSNWKGSFLSFKDIIQLVKSYVASMLVHSFTIYSWPKSLIKEL